MLLRACILSMPTGLQTDDMAVSGLRRARASKAMLFLLLHLHGNTKGWLKHLQAVQG